MAGEGDAAARVPTVGCFHEHNNYNPTIDAFRPQRLAAYLFARIYDPSLWLAERRGLRAHRGKMLAQARGLTLEIGSGTGLNLPHYPRSLDQLVLAEPDAAMRARLQSRLQSQAAGFGVRRRRRTPPVR